MSDADTVDVNDAVLRRALLRRERWAAAAVWKRFSPRVFSIFSRSLPRSKASEELTQEVMLHALDEASRARRVKCLGSLVYGQAARVLRREFRRDAFRRRYWPRSRAKAAELVLVADRTERAALLKLYDALDQLSAADRVLFVLHEFELLSDVEIADALDLPLLKTRKRLARALGRIESEVDCDPLLAAYLCDDTSLDRDLQEGA
ncbi:MAG TPA: sigma-70 family RNA polymerase sigma factor [Polyangiaceae bacterium]|nr:sigma-70 family RNA polymerase sigma factor [Polyangiaceae bacterium]